MKNLCINEKNEKIHTPHQVSGFLVLVFITFSTNSNRILSLKSLFRLYHLLSMSSFDCFLGSKDYEGWQTLCELYCTIWDEDVCVSECRFCNESFSKSRKHHCRLCGVYSVDFCDLSFLLRFVSLV